MNDNIPGIAYASTFVAGIMIGFAPAPWGHIGLVLAVVAFSLPLIAFVIRRDDAITAAEGWHEGEEFCPDCYDDYLWG